MANAATAQTALPIKMAGTGLGGWVTPIVVTFDTTGADLTIYTPASGFYAGIVGWQYAEASAHSLIVKSGSTTLITYEMPANSGRDDKLGKGIILSTAVSEALKMNCGTAAVSSMLIYIVEFGHLDL